jgi:hypothetical protein
VRLPIARRTATRVHVGARTSDVVSDDAGHRSQRVRLAVGQKVYAVMVDNLQDIFCTK